jgi:hypothetical protein
MRFLNFRLIFLYEIVFLHIYCEINRSSFLATVFSRASVFNRDLNQWDVANVKNMDSSKSIRILKNGLT